MDILLTIAPPFWEYLPPLGLATLKANLSDTISVSVYDFNIETFNFLQNNCSIQFFSDRIWGGSKKDNELLFENVNKHCPDLIQKFKEYIRKYNPKIIGFSVFRSNLSFTTELVAFLKQEFPDIFIILGGPEIFENFALHSKTLSQQLIQQTDVFVIGDGEEVLEEIVKTILSGSKFPKSVYASNKEKMTAIPFPDFSSFDLKLYKKQGVLPIQMSRGCINNCAFCSEKFLSPYFRSRSPEDMISLLKFYIESHGISHFIFYDSLINGNLSYLEKFCDKVIENNLDIHWEGQFLIRENIHQELLFKMKEAGAYNLFIGLESGSDRILEKIHKGFTTKQAESLFKKLNKAQLHFEVSLIVNLPYEKEQDFQDTLDFLKRNRNIIPKVAQINEWQPYAGTELRKKFKKNKSNRVEKMVEFLKENNIKFTSAYIRNLYL